MSGRLDPAYLTGRCGPVFLDTEEMQRAAQAVRLADRMAVMEIESYAERFGPVPGSRTYRVRPAQAAAEDQARDIEEAADYLCWRGLAVRQVDVEGTFIRLIGGRS